MSNFSNDLRVLVFNYPELKGQKMSVRQALADELCCHPNTLMNWLADPTTMPAQEFIKLCIILKIKQEDVFPDLRYYKQRLIPLVKDYLRSPHIQQKEIDL